MTTKTTLDKNRNQLIELGAEVLADTLLELSKSDKIIKDVIKRLISSPDEKVKLFKTKLSQIKRRTSFVDWNEGAAFAYELRELLSLLNDVKNPEIGLELVGQFLEADESIFERCDDSNGEIGGVFGEEAANLFVNFACRCTNKLKVIDYVIKLNQNDGYGVRDFTFDRASEYLEETMLRALVDQLWIQAENVNENKEHAEYTKKHWYGGIQQIAKQLKDAPLFEKAIIAHYGNTTLSTSGFLDIAEVYFESGEPQVALSWMNKIEKGTYLLSQRNALLLKIYGELGDVESQAKIAWDIFKANRCKETFDQLLGIIGSDEEDEILENEISSIMNEATLSYVDAKFLLSEGYMDELENYLLARLDQIDGQYDYSSALFFIPQLEISKKYLISSLIHRILLNSILERANSKYYGYGVRYLKKLDSLDPSVLDWKTYSPHQDYFQQLKTKHGRKSSFWSQY
jgi:hypothetical protein